MNGKTFEKDIYNQLKILENKKIGFFIKSPTPIKTINKKIIFYEKALCDFIGILNNKFFIIEAKEISEKRFDFRRLKEHQIKQLKLIEKYGGISIIIFNIKIKNKIVLVRINKFLNEKKKSNKKSINIDLLEKIGDSIFLNELNDYLLVL